MGISMRELYLGIGKLLETIDFNAIWHGFHVFPFALYDDEHVYLQNEVMPYDRCFLGNTSIEYNGEFIAIWKVMNPETENTEMLAANFVHEMFHAFQLKNKENRFPNDLLMLDYPENEENYKTKYSENMILVNAFQSDDAEEKKALLKRFMSARKYREGLIGDIIKQEYLNETIEGMAEYAGLMALKQISPEKYANQVSGYINNLYNINSRFFDIRRMLYFSGAIFLMTLADAGLDFFHTIGETDDPLFRIVSDNTKAEKPSINFDEILLLSEMEQHLDNKKRKFDEFLASQTEKTEGNFLICGYDPMNMIKMDNSILCSHFIMLQKKGDTAPIFVQGPVVVNLKNGSVNEAQSYIRKRS